jgi:hypothetical protein
MDQNDAQLEQGVTPEKPNENNAEGNNNMASLLESEGLGLDFPSREKPARVLLPVSAPARSCQYWDQI